MVKHIQIVKFLFVKFVNIRFERKTSMSIAF